MGVRLSWIAMHVATGYAAKVTCSLALNSGQNPVQVFRDYVSLELSPFGPALRVSVSERGAEASAFGLIHVRAVYRRGLGCTLVPDGSEERLALAKGIDLPRRRLDPAVPWPDGGAGPAAPSPSPEIAAAIERAFREPNPPEPGRVRQTKAVVIVQDGRLVAERYAPGYGPRTPMLSWSMAKSVTATLVGIMVGDGRLALHAPAPVPEWSAPTDPRHAITLDQLLRSRAGLPSTSITAQSTMSRACSSRSPTRAPSPHRARWRRRPTRFGPTRAAQRTWWRGCCATPSVATSRPW